MLHLSNQETHGESAWPGYEEIPLVEALNGTIKPDNIPEGTGLIF